MHAEQGRCYWRDVLGSPVNVVAPMVDASELPWRLLSRRHGGQLCYTPMLHAGIFVRDAKYRQEGIVTCAEDRPLIVQFCANDPDIFCEAARLVQGSVYDGVDLNLGCPQTIAKRGNYGAFLQEEWDLLKRMIGGASLLDIPISAKVRVFEDKAKTIQYGQMLEKAGCKLITVHGRTIDQKGPLTGLASWERIKEVKEAVTIPVLANGNIQCLADVERCLQETGVNGVMSAEGNLYNPALFEGRQPPVWEMALEYLDIVAEYPCPISYTRGHLFKLFHHCLGMEENIDLREQLAKSIKLNDFYNVANQLKDRWIPYHIGTQTWEAKSNFQHLKYSPLLCQSYVRMPPEVYIQRMKEFAERDRQKDKEREAMLMAQIRNSAEQTSISPDPNENNKRCLEENPEELMMSKKKWKKLQKTRKKLESKLSVLINCKVCPNPRGLRCIHSMCRKCCKVVCQKEELDCESHRILIKTKRSKGKETKQAKLKDSGANNSKQSVEEAVT